VDLIKGIYERHGYPAQIVSSTITKTFAKLQLQKSALPAPLAPKPPEPIRISIPYTGNLYYQVRRLALPLGIDVVAKPHSSLASILLSRSKHHLPKDQLSDVIYAIQCSCEVEGKPSWYIGETEREVGTRMKDHKEAWLKRQANKSAFGEHHQCEPHFADYKVLASQSNHRLRLLTESAFIRAVESSSSVMVSPQDAAVNRNSGTMLNDRWIGLLKDVCANRLTDRRH
jgi:hypothetical protein